MWTAAHHRIPLLLVIAHNQSYDDDEEHRERRARARGRPIDNRWIGERMVEPAMNLAGLASNLGVEGFGPITDLFELGPTFARALAAIHEGRPALVDVRAAAADAPGEWRRPRRHTVFVSREPNLGEPILDLHGLRLREALQRTDAFVRAEQAHGTVAVRIITAMGGGILKKAIGDLLANHSSVARVTCRKGDDSATGRRRSARRPAAAEAASVAVTHRNA